MLSAPATIPAMIEAIFPAGFAVAHATRVALNRSYSPIRSEEPVYSANAVRGSATPGSVA